VTVNVVTVIVDVTVLSVTVLFTYFQATIDPSTAAVFR